MKYNAAYFTFEKSEAGNLYYFAPVHRAAGPYLNQRHVEAIIDIDEDGKLAGVELIYNMPEPQMSEAGERNKGDLLEEIGLAIEASNDKAGDWEYMAYPYEWAHGSYNRIISVALGILMHRGLLTEQALEILKEKE